MTIPSLAQAATSLALTLGLLSSTALGAAVSPSFDFGSNPVLFDAPQQLFTGPFQRSLGVSSATPTLTLKADGFVISGLAYTLRAGAPLPPGFGSNDMDSIWSADRLYAGDSDGVGRLTGETTVTTSGFAAGTVATLEVHARLVNYESDSGGIDFATFTHEITGNGVTPLSWDLSGAFPQVTVVDDALEIYSRIVWTGAPTGATISFASTYGGSVSSRAVPEPASCLMLASGALGLAGLARRRARG